MKTTIYFVHSEVQTAIARFVGLITNEHVRTYSKKQKEANRSLGKYPGLGLPRWLGVRRRHSDQWFYWLWLFKE